MQENGIASLHAGRTGKFRKRPGVCFIENL